MLSIQTRPLILYLIQIKWYVTDNPIGNPTYTTLTEVEIFDNHKSAFCFFPISTKDEKQEFPSLC
jgi:hypothetical protein